MAFTEIYLRYEIRKYHFSHRVVDDWNRLPEEAIKSKTLNIFKNNIDSFLSKPLQRNEPKYKYVTWNQEAVTRH
jgi:hypothetical protein